MGEGVRHNKGQEHIIVGSENGDCSLMRVVQASAEFCTYECMKLGHRTLEYRKNTFLKNYISFFKNKGHVNAFN